MSKSQTDRQRELHQRRREHAATLLMASLILPGGKAYTDEQLQWFAVEAVRAADALIAELERTRKPEEQP